MFFLSGGHIALAVGPSLTALQPLTNDSHVPTPPASTNATMVGDVFVLPSPCTM